MFVLNVLMMSIALVVSLSASCGETSFSGNGNKGSNQVKDPIVSTDPEPEPAVQPEKVDPLSDVFSLAQKEKIIFVGYQGL